MKEGSRANALLVELLLVIFFFMISAAILVQVFADAKLKSRTAYALNASMPEAQNIAEDLYAAENPDEVLAGYGFTRQDDAWVLEKQGNEGANSKAVYLLKVTLREEEKEAGVLRTYDVSGIEIVHDQTGAEKENILLTIPSTRYIPKEVSP